jgi:hypothetical protein
MQITTIGLDIAKNVFQVHGIDGKEKVVVRKQLRRGQHNDARPMAKRTAARTGAWSAASVHRDRETASVVPARRRRHARSAERADPAPHRSRVVEHHPTGAGRAKGQCAVPDRDRARPGARLGAHDDALVILRTVGESADAARAMGYSVRLGGWTLFLRRRKPAQSHRPWWR